MHLMQIIGWIGHKSVAKTSHFLGGMGASRVWSALIAKVKVRLLK